MSFVQFSFWIYAGPNYLASSPNKKVFHTKSNISPKLDIKVKRKRSCKTESSEEQKTQSFLDHRYNELSTNGKADE